MKEPIASPHGRIAIVGGGPGGLVLARILHLGGVAADVYEQESHPLERPQGGTLDIHGNAGQLALHDAGLTAEFLQIARYEDQGSRLFDEHGTLWHESQDSSAGDRPEVDRTALRKMLLDSIPAEAIQWGRKLREVRLTGDGRHELVFTDGVVGPYDLVVGADGAWSRVRPLLSSYRPQYTGITFIEFGIDEADTLHPGLSRLVGRGKLHAIGSGKALIVQRNANAHLRGYAILRVPEDWAASRFDFSSPASVRATLEEIFAGWSPDLTALFRASNDRLLPRALHALPVGHHWTHRKGLTLLGDAAHLMSPFGGDGVNLAMVDGADLARRLLEATDWDQAVADYETELFIRSEEPARFAAEAVATQLSHEDLALSIAFMNEHEEAVSG